uniref:Putative secreted protein n=1 Tax=Anopheles triannulatus TaxID=58253 RepID=A0A2M4B5K9_9DIPT
MIWNWQIYCVLFVHDHAAVSGGVVVLLRNVHTPSFPGPRTISGKLIWQSIFHNRPPIECRLIVVSTFKMPLSISHSREFTHPTVPRQSVSSIIPNHLTPSLGSSISKEGDTYFIHGTSTGIKLHHTPWPLHHGQPQSYRAICCKLDLILPLQLLRQR